LKRRVRQGKRKTINQHLGDLFTKEKGNHLEGIRGKTINQGIRSALFIPQIVGGRKKKRGRTSGKLRRAAIIGREHPKPSKRDQDPRGKKKKKTHILNEDSI